MMARSALIKGLRSTNGPSDEGRGFNSGEFWGGLTLKADFRKLTAFCWNVQDGRMPPSELVDFQKEKALVELPSLLDYAGYVVSMHREINRIVLRHFSSSSRLSLLARPLIMLITESGLKQACLSYQQGQILRTCHRLVKNGRYLEVERQP